MELVSVIVPVYNVERYLEECVQSLLKQTYSDIEIILVDDGSKDSSGKMCDQFAKEDSRINVIHKENAGLGFARNSGLTVAKGKYVTFIDSDDVADENLVETLMLGIHESKSDTCIGGFKRISENGTITFVEQYDIVLFTGAEVYNELFARMLGSAPNKHDAIRMSVWNVMYSMDIIRKYKIEFPSERKFISEDIIWDSEYYRYAKRVKVIDSIAYNYRITPGSLTQKYKPDMLKKICGLYNEMTDRLSNDETKITRLQRQFFVNLRECLKQENPKVSKKRNPEIMNSIKEIVNSETVHTVATTYEKIIEQHRQKFFVKLVKSKRIYALYMLVKIGGM